MDVVKGTKVLVVGLGKSGIAAAGYCASRGARVCATDAKRADELGDLPQELSELGIELSLGDNDASLVEGAEVVIVSPGVPLTLPLFEEARARGLPVIGEMELAVQQLDRSIVAVTGTNGKTTTTALIGHIFASSGIRVCVAGNIGTPILSCLDEACAADVVVLEVSSFQMETTPSLKADVAVWLNATEDHVDRHGSFQAYVDSKARLFDQMDANGFKIYNANDTVVADRVANSGGKLVPFDAEGGVSGPLCSGNWARCADGELIVYTEKNGEHRYPLSAARLVGLHNRENMLASLLAAELMDVAPRTAQKALSTFEGLPHRMQFVAEVDGISFYDDSKGTNVGAVVRALRGFSQPVVLIAGGLTKEADLTPLAAEVEARTRKVILIGEAAVEMERLFSGRTETERASSMEEAVRKACAAVKPGDAVLLSPACASFDMFRDYNERGDAFQAAVKHLVIDKQSRVTSHE